MRVAREPPHVRDLDVEREPAAGREVCGDPSQAGRELEAELTARLEIDRALALAKAGDVSGARAAFEAVSRMPVDESIRGYARQRIKDLDARR